jgi:hypothetical protein
MSLDGIASQAFFKLDHAALARKSGQNNRKCGKDASRSACLHRRVLQEGGSSRLTEAAEFTE